MVKDNPMDKVRRVERMVAMTKLLVDSPQKLIPLNYFCDFFGMAKSMRCPLIAPPTSSATA